MKNKNILLLIIFISMKLYCKDFYVKEIYFKGFNRISIDSISKLIPINIGATINEQNIQYSIISILNTGNFNDVKIFKNEKDQSLTIQVIEKYIIYKINYPKNTILEKNYFLNLQKKYNFFPGLVLEVKNLKEIKKDLESYYLKYGKYESTVKILLRKTFDHQIIINLLVEEGDDSIVEDVNIIGNKKYSLKKTLSQFALNNSYYWYVFHDDKYTKKKLSEDIIALKNFYLNRGHVNFKINKIAIKLTPDKKSVYIYIYINEGDQYKISQIYINNDMPNDILKKFIKSLELLNNKTYKILYINMIIDKLKKILGFYGYVNPDISITKSKNDNLKTITIIFNIIIKDRKYVKHVNFIGNLYSRDLVIRNKIFQEENNWLNLSLIEKSKNILSNIRKFREVNYEINSILNDSSLVDVNYILKEYNEGSINFSVGYGQNNNISIQSYLYKNNIFDSGNNINFNVSKSINTKTFTFSWNNPYILFNDINIGGDLFFNTSQSTETINFEDFYHMNYGTNGFLGFPINNNNILKIGLGYSKHNFFNIQQQFVVNRFLKSVNVDPLDGYYAKNYIFNTGWTYTDLNKKIFPTIGNEFLINGFITIPGSDNKFYKIILDTHTYVPLSRNLWIFAIHSKFSFGNGFHQYNKELPFYENFSVNNNLTVRGFQNIGPKAIYYDFFHQQGLFFDVNHYNNYCDIYFNHYNNKEEYFDEPKELCLSGKQFCKSNNPVGGNAVSIINLELIMPKISFINNFFHDSIRASFFVDFGMFWDTKWENFSSFIESNVPIFNNFENIRSSFGLSLQWISPFGPVGVSYAYPIKQYKDDKLEQFQINIGKFW